MQDARKRLLTVVLVVIGTLFLFVVAPAAVLARAKSAPHESAGRSKHQFTVEQHPARSKRPASPAPVRGGQTPFPAIQGSLPPVNVLESIPYQLTPRQQCDALAVNFPGARTSNVCRFMDTFGPTGQATPAPLAKDVEQTQLCDDVVTVMNTISNSAMSTRHWRGAGEYYFDSDNQSGQSPGPLGNCYMLVNTDPGSSNRVLSWELVANEDGVPTNPLSSITAFVNSIPVSVYKYDFPYPNEP